MSIIVPQSLLCACRRARFGFRLALALVWACFLGVLGATALQAATFEATLDRDAVTVGESATLTLQFEGGQPREMPVPPSQPNLQMANGGESQSFNIVNGHASRSISQAIILTPTQPGEYHIPALRAEVDGQVLTSQPMVLKATKADSSPTDQSGDQLAFFKLVVPKKEVYVGEVFEVEFQCYMREGVANGENILQNFDGFGGCPIKAEGVSVLRTAHAQRRRVRVGNAIYGVSTLVTALSPVKAGPLSVGSIDVNLTLQLPMRGQRRRDPFADPFGMFQQYEEKHATLSAEPQNLTALLLPQDHVPPNFNGAVGSFTLSFTASPTNVAAGDPITVRVQLSGQGAFDSLALPQQAAWKDFKTYPPTTKVETSDALGLQGTKTFEQVVVPQTADLKELPPVSFSFFDPDHKSYQTLSQPAIPLVVRPSASAPVMPTALSTSRPAQEPPPTQDIVPNKQRLGALAQLSVPLARQPWFWGLQSLPLLVFISSLLWRQRADLLAHNPRLRRQRQVARILREGLEQLRRFAAEKKSDDFFATLFRLLQEQLGERLDLPATAITEAVIDEHLRPRAVAQPTLAALQELFQACNLARYAPVKSSQELAAVIPKFEAVLRELQNLKPGETR